MTAINFPDVLNRHSWLPAFDGGGYHAEPGDPGGGTSWGVTEGAWAEARTRRLFLSTTVLAKATQDDLRAVLHDGYWNVCHCDELPAGVDVAVFDAAMISGPGTAVRWLQFALGVPQDGVIGNATRDALRVCDPVNTLLRLVTRDENFIASTRQFALFGRGWEHRLSHLAMYAFGLAFQP